MKKILAVIIILCSIYLPKISAQGWQWIDTGYPYIIFDVCFPQGQSNIGFAVGSTLTFGGDGIILKTTDGGSTWNKISADTIPGLKTVYFKSELVGYAGGYQNYLMKTNDGGSTWSLEVIDSKLWYFNNIKFCGDNNGIIVSYPSAVYYTTDGGTTWSHAIGIKHTVENVCYVDENTLYLVGGDEKIYKSTTGGFLWVEIYSGITLNTFFGVEFLDPNYGIVCGENGKVLVTTNGGNDWTISTTGGNGLMHGVHFADQSNAYVVGSPEQVFKTTDGGSTWLSDFNGGTSIDLYKVIFTENNAGLICGAQGKFLINNDNIIPVELSDFTASSNGNIVHLNWTTKTELNNSGFEVLRSTDINNWLNIAFVPGSGTTSETRSYSFKDDELKSGSYSYRLKQIDFDGSCKYSDVVNVIISIPELFDLEQNFPNPFNPSTVIEFSLQEDVSNVKLTVYNTLGEKVEEVVNSSLSAGKYSYQWNAKNVAAGMYVYELRTDKFVSMKKMVFLK